MLHEAYVQHLQSYFLSSHDDRQFWESLEIYAKEFMMLAHLNLDPAKEFLDGPINVRMIDSTPAPPPNGATMPTATVMSLAIAIITWCFIKMATTCADNSSFNPCSRGCPPETRDGCWQGTQGMGFNPCSRRSLGNLTY